jgi:hypothetical protein
VSLAGHEPCSRTGGIAVDPDELEGVICPETAKRFEEDVVIERAVRRAVTVGLAVLATLAIGRPFPAGAATLTWNTCQGNSSGLCSFSVPASTRSSSGTGVDQVYTFDAREDATKDVDARAFRTQNNDGTGTVQKTTINIFGGGLGAGGEGSPQHAVDNVGPDEFIVFKLPSDTTRPLSLKIGFKDVDADITTWIGGKLGDASNDHDALALLLSGTFSWNQGNTLVNDHGYVQQTFLDVPTNTAQVFSNNAAGRYLIIGARHEGTSTSDGGEDKFKLLSVAADQPTQIPLPGSIVLLGAGLVGAAIVRRRRATEPR